MIVAMEELTGKSKPFEVKFKMPSLHVIDIFALQLLVIFFLLHQLQHLIPSLIYFRYLLLGYLYVRFFFLLKGNISSLLFWILTYLCYSCFVAFQTYLSVGNEIAIKAFSVFINVAVLAPLFAIIVRTHEEIKRFLKIWFFIAFIGACSLVYQIFVNPIVWLPENWIGTGTMIRYKTLIGDPNEGGVVSIISLISLIVYKQNLIWKFILSFTVFVFLVFSASKAALAGCLLFLLFIFIKQSRIKIRNLIVFIIVCLITLFSFAFIMTAQKESKLNKYITLNIARFTGDEGRGNTSFSMIEDLSLRLFKMPEEYIQSAVNKSDFYFLDIIIGSSFGMASFVAWEKLGNDVYNPHNAYLEFYLAGGFIMLAFLLIIFFKTIKIYRQRIKSLNERSLILLLLYSFVIYLIMLMIRPEHSNPINGALFWMIIGLAANLTLNKDKLAIAKN